MRGAVFFGVDGTLEPGTSSAQHLAGCLGHLKHLAEAEDAYAAGQMGNREVSVLDAAGWRLRTSSDVADYLQHLPLVDGITEAVAWCRDHDLAPYLATLAWQPVGNYLCQRFGFDGACGPTLDEEAVATLELWRSTSTSSTSATSPSTWRKDWISAHLVRCHRRQSV